MDLLFAGAGLVLTTLWIALLIRKLNIVPLVTLGTLGYTWLYILASGLLLWIDRFSVTRAAFGTLLLDLVLILVTLILRRRLPAAAVSAADADDNGGTPGSSGPGNFLRQLTCGIAIDCNIRPYLWLLIILLAAFPLTAEKYGFYGMGQDEGCYQTEAIGFVYNKNDVQKDFKEYALLDTEEEKAAFAQIVEEKLVGANNYQPERLFASEKAEKSPVSYVWHGIATYPALLALVGSIAGIANMTAIQTLFWAGTLVFIYLTLMDLKVRKELRVLMTLLAALSPIMLWVSKSTLTEMAAAAMLAAFIYCILREERAYIYLSALPIIAFGYFHLTLFFNMPVIILLYWVLWYFKGERAYLVSACLSVLGFFTGFLMMMCISGRYVIENFTHKLAIFTEPGLILLFGGLTLAVLILSFVMDRCSQKPRLPLEKLQTPAFYMLLRLAILACFALFAVTAVKNIDDYGSLLQSARMLTFNGFLLALGVFVPAIALLIAFIKPSLVTDKVTSLACTLFFGYSALVYSAVLKRYIYYYYYYGRYLVPFIPIVIIFSALVLNRINRRAAGVTALASLAMVAPYLSFFMTCQDDTKTTFEALEALTSIINENDAVIIAPELILLYTLPISYMTDACVYPAYGEWTEQAEKLADGGASRVYYLGTTAQEELSVVAYAANTVKSEDMVLIDDTLLCFPQTAEETESHVVLSRYLSEELIYDVTNPDADLVITGMGRNEGNMAWTNGEEVYLECYLEEKAYQLVIDLGAKVDLVKTRQDHYTVQVYMNDTYVGDLVLNAENNGDVLTIEIPEGLTVKGRNELRLICETWSPADYGSGDTRELCLPVRAFIFQPQ